jgi:hypothetical protein
MDAVADLLRDDDAPPQSGIRIRVEMGGPESPTKPPHVHPSWVSTGPERPVAALPSDREVLAEVGEEVFFEVWGAVSALAPLQGKWWFAVGVGQLGAAAGTLTDLRCDPAPRAATLRARWPELVPGYAAMDRLVGMMVDAIC